MGPSSLSNLIRLKLSTVPLKSVFGFFKPGSYCFSWAPWHLCYTGAFQKLAKDLRGIWEDSETPLWHLPHPAFTSASIHSENPKLSTNMTVAFCLSPSQPIMRSATGEAIEMYISSNAVPVFQRWKPSMIYPFGGTLQCLQTGGPTVVQDSLSVGKICWYKPLHKDQDWKQPQRMFYFIIDIYFQRE